MMILQSLKTPGILSNLSITSTPNQPQSFFLLLSVSVGAVSWFCGVDGGLER